MEEQTVQSEQSENAPVLVLEEWCIYRVPSQLRNVDEAAYTPQSLSIGPFHYGNPKLRDMEAHKKKCYESFCIRSSKSKEDLSTFMEGRRDNSLKCYAGTFNFKSDTDFENVILVDACFIIELFLSNSEPENQDSNYYILRSPWLRKAVERDLILFENQLPYSLLQDLYDYAFPNASSNSHLGSGELQEQEHVHQDSTKQCCCCFPYFRSNETAPTVNINSRENSIQSEPFASSNSHLGSGGLQAQEHVHQHSTKQCCFPYFRPNETAPTVNINSRENSIQSEPFEHHFLELTCKFFKDYSKGKSVRNPFKPKHFTDLVRHFLCPYKELPCKNIYDDPVKIKYHARKLKAAGVKFIPLREPFVIKEVSMLTSNLACFTPKGLELTRLWAENEAECIFRNTMALEQIMYPQQPYICCYFLLMHQLIDSEEDVDVLIDDGVIMNLLGSNKAVVHMIRSLCEHIKEVYSCYADICHDINKHYQKVLYRPLVIMRQVYFKDLWRASSAILGFVVLVFSILTSLKTFKLL